MNVLFKVYDSLLDDYNFLIRHYNLMHMTERLPHTALEWLPSTKAACLS